MFLKGQGDGSIKIFNVFTGKQSYTLNNAMEEPMPITQIRYKTNGLTIYLIDGDHPLHLVLQRMCSYPSMQMAAYSIGIQQVASYFIPFTMSSTSFSLLITNLMELSLQQGVVTALSEYTMSKHVNLG